MLIEQKQIELFAPCTSSRKSPFCFARAFKDLMNSTEKYTEAALPHRLLEINLLPSFEELIFCLSYVYL